MDHGKSPKGSGCGTPSKSPKWLLNGGDPNHLRVLGWSSKYPQPPQGCNHHHQDDMTFLGDRWSGPKVSCVTIASWVGDRSKLYSSNHSMLASVAAWSTKSCKLLVNCIATCFFFHWGLMQLELSQLFRSHPISYNSKDRTGLWNGWTKIVFLRPPIYP